MKISLTYLKLVMQTIMIRNHEVSVIEKIKGRKTLKQFNFYY